MAVTSSAAFDPNVYLQARTRWHPIEYAFWASTLLPFLLFPNHLVLASQIAITALFALSLDLILGYAGIVSLGHAAFFGLGAYTAGIISKYGYGEPLIGLVVGPAVAGLAGYASSFIIARFRHLTLIMITMGLGFLLLEAANSAEWLTGGSDGLQGIRIGPILGRLRFDLWGYTAYAYSLTVLFLVFLVARRLINSPFGLALTRHPREPHAHAGHRGAEPLAYPHDLYDLGHRRRHRRHRARADDQHGLARRPRFSALGRGCDHPGSRRRRPALWRSRGRHHLHGRARSILGDSAAVLVLLDRRAARHRGDAAAQRHSGRPGGARCFLAGQGVVSIPALSTQGLDKRFGSLVVASDINLVIPHGVRYALIGPNGAGKTTLINLITGMLRPDAGKILLGDADITAFKPDARVKRGLVRTFQINALFPHLNALEAVTLAVCERRGVAGEWWKPLRPTPTPWRRPTAFSAR